MTESTMNWRNLCYRGWKSETQYWIRWTSPGGLYYWLHPIENRWVGEPDQITMPDFPSASAGLLALMLAPLPPGAIEALCMQADVK